MDREEKVLEMTMDALISRCQDLRNSLVSCIFKLETEYETVTWPTVLDNFALLSGQINNLMKILKNEKTPLLRNRILLPLLLSPDRDEELAKITEGRVQAFNHEMVPNYLRTKPEPEVELKENQLFTRSVQVTPEAIQKQITTLTKIANTTIDLVKNRDADWENEASQRANASQTSSLTDTSTIIAAINFGKGLKASPVIGSPKGGPLPSAPQNVQQIGPRPTGPTKAPASIKTNIKSAASIHPYSR